MSDEASCSNESLVIVQSSQADEKEDRFVAVMDAAESYQTLHAELTRQLKLGWMDISRSKYSMGIKSVSQTQYTEEAQATITVCPAEVSEVLELRSEPSERDPLHSFGGLVSPHLRTAQTSFHQVLETAVKLCNISHSIKRKSAPVLELEEQT